jgi:hypothetical protein
MSLSLSPFIVDHKQLTALFGSKDQNLYKRIEKATWDHLHSDGDTLAAVEALIDGNLKSADVSPPENYLIGLELIYEVLGKVPEAEEHALTSYRAGWLEEYVSEVQHTLWDSKPLAPFEELPYGAFFLSREFIATQITELKGIDPTQRRADVQDAIREFIA